MGSLYKQIYRYTRPRAFRHNENLWPYTKITRAESGEIRTLQYKGQRSAGQPERVKKQRAWRGFVDGDRPPPAVLIFTAAGERAGDGCQRRLVSL
jgi:hypothetical protein